MPVVDVSDNNHSPRLMGEKNSNDPTRKTNRTVGDVAVNDSLMIIGGALLAMVLLMFSVRKYIV